MAAPRLSKRVANVFLRLCEETSVERAHLIAALPALGEMNLWWLRFGGHRDLRKRVLESFRLKDTIRNIESKCYGRNGKPKDSLDQDTRSQRSWIIVLMPPMMTDIVLDQLHRCDSNAAGSLVDVEFYFCGQQHHLYQMYLI